MMTKAKQLNQLILVGVLVLAGGARLHAADSPAATLAAQIRLQGFSCKEPVDAQKDATLSKADEIVWLVKCADAAYRITLHPNMAAGVERISP